MDKDDMIHKNKAGLVSQKAIGLSWCSNHLSPTQCSLERTNEK